MACWIRNLFSPSTSKDSIDTPSVLSSESPSIVPSPVVQTDVRHYRRMKKLRKSINSQLETAQMKALKPHAADCSDILGCNKLVCFEREPDKIVSDTYTVNR